MSLFDRLFSSKLMPKLPPPLSKEDVLPYRYNPPEQLSTLTDGRITILLDTVIDTIVEDFEKNSDNWQLEFGKFSAETTYYNYATTERRYTVSRFRYNSDDKIKVIAMNEEEFTPAQQERIRNAMTKWHQKRDEKVKVQRRIEAVESLKRVFPNSVLPKESHV